MLKFIIVTFAAFACTDRASTASKKEKKNSGNSPTGDTARLDSSLDEDLSNMRRDTPGRSARDEIIPPSADPSGTNTIIDNRADSRGGFTPGQVPSGSINPSPSSLKPPSTPLMNDSTLPSEPQVLIPAADDPKSIGDAPLNGAVNMTITYDQKAGAFNFDGVPEGMRVLVYSASGARTALRFYENQRVHIGPDYRATTPKDLKGYPKERYRKFVFFLQKPDKSLCKTLNYSSQEWTYGTNKMEWSVTCG